MGLFTITPADYIRKAEQHERRAEQLDRDGKFIRANVERQKAEKYLVAAAKSA